VPELAMVTVWMVVPSVEKFVMDNPVRGQIGKNGGQPTTLNPHAILKIFVRLITIT
jgi:hypothetical protein